MRPSEPGKAAFGLDLSAFPLLRLDQLGQVDAATLRRSLALLPPPGLAPGGGESEAAAPAASTCVLGLFIVDRFECRSGRLTYIPIRLFSYLQIPAAVRGAAAAGHRAGAGEEGAANGTGSQRSIIRPVPVVATRAAQQQRTKAIIRGVNTVTSTCPQASLSTASSRQHPNGGAGRVCHSSGAKAARGSSDWADDTSIASDNAQVSTDRSLFAYFLTAVCLLARMHDGTGDDGAWLWSGCSTF